MSNFGGYGTPERNVGMTSTCGNSEI
ncbi:hypothetical protein [Nostoc sp. C052]